MIAVDEVGDAAHRLGDERLLVVRRDDDCDALALDHGPLFGVRPGTPAQDRVGDDRRQRTEQEPDQTADDDRVARARGRRPHRGGLLHDAALLHLPGEREQLLGVRAVDAQAVQTRLVELQRSSWRSPGSAGGR